MEAFLIYALFAVGLLLIIKGGDWFVSGATWVAEVTLIPKFIIGATIMSFATTLPEILVSTIAAVEAHGAITEQLPDATAFATEKIGMAVGNGIGSFICNTAFILAIGTVFMPTETNDRKLKTEVIIIGLILASLIVLTYKGSLTGRGSIVLLALFALYLFQSAKSFKADLEYEDFSERPPSDRNTVIINVVKVIVGAVLLFVGSRLIVNNGGAIAKSWGVSESVFGVTMVAIGTSLPELVTAIIAIIKKQPSMSVGNIIGANIINIALILPLCSFIYGGIVPVSQRNILLDFPVAVVVSVIAFVPTVFTRRFYRWQGILLLLVYAAYLLLIAFGLDRYLALFTA